MAIRYNSGAAREATGLKQMPIRARTHKTGAGGMSASLIGHCVKRLQTIHHYSVDVARGFVLLFGNRHQGPFYHRNSRTRWNNLFTAAPAHRRAHSVSFCDRCSFLTDKPNYISIEFHSIQCE